MNRREFLNRGVSLAIIPAGFALLPSVSFGQQSQIDVSQFIDISNSQSHCNQDHQHDPLPMNIDPVAQLNWSAGDTGHNEGAAAGVQLLLKYGFGVPDGWGQLAGDAVGEVWKRREMMSFAKDISKSGNLPIGVSLAILSQWHNCHAFRTLINNVPTVVNWLLS